MVFGHRHYSIWFSPRNGAKRSLAMNALSDSVIQLLRNALGEALLIDPAECLMYSYDNSRQQAMPQAVALVETTEQVQALVRICHEHRIALTARGRGTNTTGAALPINGGIVVSFERMNRIVDIRPGDRVAIVQPGVLNGDLQLALKSLGLFWPPDPTSAAYSSIGGNLACNAGGPRAVKYGATRDNVLAIKAVNGCGELLSFGAAVTKSSTGFDLSRLLIGSEGTLALMVEASLKLSPTPTATRSLRALYRDVQSAAHAVARLMSQAITPSMLEFMDGQCVQLARDVGGVDIPDAGALLMIEVDGDESSVELSANTIKQVAMGDGCISVDIALDANSREQLWAARKALSPSLRSLASGKINEDVVVPVSKIPALVSGVKDIAQLQSLNIVCFGHAGNGNLHVNILYEKEDAEQTDRAQIAMHAVFELALKLKGTLSGEHGIGISKRDFMAKALDANTLKAMREIKNVFDPAGILNPGKVLPI
jgi:D-lactate dehydrogenase (quinone)